MKNDINGKSNPAKYSKNFRYELNFFRLIEVFLGRHIVRLAHVTNVDRISFVTHRVSLWPIISHLRGNFRLFKTSNDSSALVPLLHFRLGFK